MSAGYENATSFGFCAAFSRLNWVDGLIHYYSKGALKMVPFGQALAKYIREVELQEENAMLVLYVAAILSDSMDASVAERSRELLIAIKDSELQARFEMRDLLKELAYQGKEPQWLKSFLIERAIR